MSELDRLIDRTALVEAVDTIFDTVDAKDWDAVERLFTPKLWADFTSLAGGEPAEITNTQLVDGWRVGLHARKESFHLVAHHRVAVDGDTAVVRLKGYAYNALAAELGGAVWEVWGGYEIPFVRTPAGWLAAGLTFRATRTSGDDAVRTHTLA